LETFGGRVPDKGRVNSRKKFFDIGVAGPIGGFFACCFGKWLAFGFLDFTEASYIYSVSILIMLIQISRLGRRRF